MIIQAINSWAHQNHGLLSIIAILISLISLVIVIIDRFCIFFKSIIKWFIWKLRGDFKIEPYDAKTFKALFRDSLCPNKAISQTLKEIRYGVETSTEFKFLIKNPLLF